MAMSKTIVTIIRTAKPMNILVAIMRAERIFFFLAVSIMIYILL